MATFGCTHHGFKFTLGKMTSYFKTQNQNKIIIRKMKEESSKKEQGRSFCKEFVNKIES